MGDYGIASHEHVGARFLLDMGISARIALLVASHVAAKRYMAYQRGCAYLDTVSEASKRTLAYQGGPMSAQEAAEFEQDPEFEAKVLVRLCDERAKIAPHPPATPAARAYLDAITNHLRRPPN